MTEQERIDRLAIEFMEWNPRRGVNGSWYSRHAPWKRVTSADWNPFISHDDAHLLLVECGRRGLLKRLSDYLWGVNCKKQNPIEDEVETGLMTKPAEITEAVEAIKFLAAAKAAKEE